MTRQWWLGVVCVLSLASVLLARQGIVVTKDGRSLQGDIDDTPGADSVNITIYGVKTSLPRTSISTITYTGDLNQQYADRLSKLAPTDVAGRVALARWAFDNHKYDLARQADDSALKIDPKNTDARTLMETIQSTMAMDAKRDSTPPSDGPPAVAAPPVAIATPETPAAAGNGNFLTADDINMIRQAEIQSNDGNIRASFSNKVRERYLSTGDKDGPKFFAEPMGQQAMEILATGDGNLSKDVKVLTDPASLDEYRRKIQPRILAGCAASGCHGGPDGGSFYLYPNADQTAAWVTNFYILQKYSTKVMGGTGLGAGEVTRAMIDRTQPGASLLVQYGLPLNVALTPHPKVAGFKPLFATDQDPTYKAVLHWIGSSLKPFAPDYGIKYELPTCKSSTQPSTRPAE